MRIIKAKPRAGYIIQLIAYPIVFGLLIALTVILKAYIISVVFALVTIILLFNLYGESLTKIEIEGSFIFLNRGKKSERKIDMYQDVISTRYGLTRDGRGYKGYEYLQVKCKHNIEFRIDQNMYRNYKELKLAIYANLAQSRS